jgi:hypothetical protein
MESGLDSLTAEELEALVEDFSGEVEEFEEEEGEWEEGEEMEEDEAIEDRSPEHTDSPDLTKQ